MTTSSHTAESEDSVCLAYGRQVKELLNAGALPKCWTTCGRFTAMQWRFSRRQATTRGLVTFL